jgi:hypothetical protein
VTFAPPLPPGGSIEIVTTSQTAFTIKIVDPRPCNEVSQQELQAYADSVCIEVKAQGVANGYLASDLSCSATAECQLARRRTLLDASILVSGAAVFLVTSEAQTAYAAQEAAQLAAQLNSPSAADGIFADAFPESADVVSAEVEGKQVPVVVLARPPPPKSQPPPKRRPPPPASPKCSYTGTFTLVTNGRTTCTRSRATQGELNVGPTAPRRRACLGQVLAGAWRGPSPARSLRDPV